MQLSQPNWRYRGILLERLTENHVTLGLCTGIDWHRSASRFCKKLYCLSQLALWLGNPNVSLAVCTTQSRKNVSPI